MPLNPVSGSVVNPSRDRALVRRFHGSTMTEVVCRRNNRVFAEEFQSWKDRISFQMPALSYGQWHRVFLHPLVCY